MRRIPRRARPRTGGQAHAAIESKAFGPLTAELRRPEANHHDVDALLPRLARAHAFDDADDVAAVLRQRAEAATARAAGSGRARQAPRLIAELVPEAGGDMSEEMSRALSERQCLMEERADAVLEAAVVGDAVWLHGLGDQPPDLSRHAAWRRSARIVAAYRDRYRFDSDIALGAHPEDTSHKIDRARAEAALRAIERLNRPRQAEVRTRVPEARGPRL